MPLAAPSSRRRRVIHLLWLGVALADIFVLALATVLVMQGRASEEQEARGLTANYSRILEESLRGVFGKIDLVLQTVQDEAEREIARGGIQEEEMNRFLARQDARLPEALGLRVTDAQGIIRYGVKDIRVAHASIADRPQFLRMKNDPRAGLVISRPVMGRAAQKWMITLSRRLNDPQGRFAGDVHVAVGIDYFLAMFSQVDLGEKGNIGLWERDALIARYTKADARGASAGSTPPPRNCTACSIPARRRPITTPAPEWMALTAAFIFATSGAFPFISWWGWPNPIIWPSGGKVAGIPY